MTRLILYFCGCELVEMKRSTWCALCIRNLSRKETYSPRCRSTSMKSFNKKLNSNALLHTETHDIVITGWMDADGGHYFAADTENVHAQNGWSVGRKLNVSKRDVATESMAIFVVAIFDFTVEENPLEDYYKMKGNSCETRLNLPQFTFHTSSKCDWILGMTVLFFWHGLCC